MILVSQEKIEKFKKLGWWGDLTLWQLFQERLPTRAAQEAAVDAPNRADFASGCAQRWTWQQLADEAERFSAVLLRHGIGKDDVVLVQLPNVVEQFAVYLACARLGVVVTPVPVQYREHELAHIIEATQAVAAITLGRIGKDYEAAQVICALQARHPTLTTVLAWGEALPPGVVNLGVEPIPSVDEIRHLQATERSAPVTADDVFTICWTSGTEASPKGVPRSHNEWLVIAPSIIEAGELPQHARLLNPFPMVNMAGIATAFISFLVLGGTVVQHHPFSLPVFLQQLRTESIDYTVAPPPVLNLLLQNAALLEGIDFSRLRRIGSGSAPLSPWMVKGFAERYGVQIVNYFGSNEGAALSGNFSDIPDPELRATYFPRAGVEGFEWSISTTRKIRTRLVDPISGAEISEPGMVGELRFHGPNIFHCYWGAPEATARAFDENGYYKSGDLFEIAGDARQYYRYVGRSKDLVIRGGMNISSEEIEGLLAGVEGVREVAVVGVPDDVMGERLCACVVPDANAKVRLEAVNDYLRTQCRIAVYKLPEHLIVLDALPRNPVGKVLKRDLRALAADRCRQAA
ncbi:acyl--CoA ligase [Diaphorobacter ruginosibacter]|uniref:Acyl--CoA ligase n=1 Tax=Diaphorobacter ruginosibacter TaxID=1715720 RepID=A0A7G9RU20_9BURK|nr:class I adenylate-forming enzyme family protein [Diaphorobacter ruginosibacter]QNN59095.1 acyl--CoA ligase [Diaphorobacter ruginosibacter]